MASHDPSSEIESLQAEVQRLRDVILHRDRKYKDLMERHTDLVIANQQQLASGAGSRANASADGQHYPDQAVVIDLRKRLTAKETALANLKRDHKVQQDALTVAHKKCDDLHFPFQRSAMKAIQSMVDTVHTALDKSETDKELVARYERVQTALDDIGTTGRVFLQKASWVFGKYQAAEPKSYSEAAQPYVLHSEPETADKPAPTPKLTTAPAVTQPQDPAKTAQESKSIHKESSHGTPTPTPTSAKAPRVQESSKRSAGQRSKHTTNTSSAQPAPNPKTQPALDPKRHQPMAQQNPVSVLKPVSGPTPSAAAKTEKFPPLSQSSGSKDASGQIWNTPPKGPKKLSMPTAIRVTPTPVIYTPQEYLRRAEEKAAAGLLVRFTDAQQLQFDIRMGLVPDPQEQKQADDRKEPAGSLTGQEEKKPRKESPKKSTQAHRSTKPEPAHEPEPEPEHEPEPEPEPKPEPEPEPENEPENEDTDEKVQEKKYMPGGYESEELTSDDEEFYDTSDFAAPANIGEGEHGLKSIEGHTLPSEPASSSPTTNERVQEGQDVTGSFESEGPTSEEEDFYGVTDDEARKTPKVSPIMAKETILTAVPDSKGERTDEGHEEPRTTSTLPTISKVPRETTKTLEDTQSIEPEIEKVQGSQDVSTQPGIPEQPKVAQSNTSTLKATEPAQDKEGNPKNLSTRPAAPEKASSKKSSKKETARFQTTTQRFQKVISGKVKQSPASPEESKVKPPKMIISGSISSKKTSPSPSSPQVPAWKPLKSSQSGPSSTGPQIGQAWSMFHQAEAARERKAARQAAEQAEAHKRAGVVPKAPELPVMNETWKQVKVDRSTNQRGVVNVSREINRMGRDQAQDPMAALGKEANVKDATASATNTHTAGSVNEIAPSSGSTDVPLAVPKSLDTVEPPASPPKRDSALFNEVDSLKFITADDVWAYEEDINDMFGGSYHSEASQEDGTGEDTKGKSVMPPAATSPKHLSNQEAEDVPSRQMVTKSWADDDSDEEAIPGQGKHAWHNKKKKEKKKVKQQQGPVLTEKPASEQPQIEEKVGKQAP